MDGIPAHQQVHRLPSVDPEKHKLFVDLAVSHGFDPKDRWVGNYVEYEWKRLREILRQYGIDVAGKNVLEFGCNYGASAIVLHHLGSQVLGVDIDPAIVDVARANASRYGADAVTFKAVAPYTPLPLEAGWADMVVCNSVLQFVDPDQLGRTIHELDRALRVGGILLVSGTSSSLYPKGAITGRWFVNYWPRFFDKIAGPPPMRGASPLRLRSALGRRYRNMDLDDAGAAWLRVRAAFAGSAAPPRAATALAALARMTRVGPGWLTPHISAVMVKIA